MIFFIPARKGSVRLKNKNLRDVNGKPLIEWTFLSLAWIKDKTSVTVSTDDPHIMDLARAYGFSVFSRPGNLCTPKTTMSEVLFHALPKLKKHDAVTILYPTNPLRAENHILSALKLWAKKGAEDKTLMSVTPVDHRPYGLMSIEGTGFLKCNHPEGEKFYQSQGMPINYRANGAIYIIPIKVLENRDINTQLFNKKTIPFVMDDISGCEIDKEHDLVVAESYLKSRSDRNFIIAESDENTFTTGTEINHVGSSDTA